MANETREQRLAGIRERASKATKGPWFAEEDCVNSILIEDSKEYEIASVVAGEELSDTERANADFIFHARDDIPYLLSALDSERDRVLLEAAKAQCSRCMHQGMPTRYGGEVIHGWDYDDGVNCDAAAIHDLRSKGESQ